LVRVGETGVLLLGSSGIGKSECALELVSRGHALVADDVVLLQRTSSPGSGAGRLLGCAPEVIRHYMEIRGIGLLYLPELFGPESVAAEASVDLICRLEEWREDLEVERLGLERPCEEWLGVRIPCLRLPARPAGSMALLVEVAVRDHVARQRGIPAAQRLDRSIAERHRSAVPRPAAPADRP
jgi:HPr kinase/phosphorylase